MLTIPRRARPPTRTLGPASCVINPEEQQNLVGKVISNYRLRSVLGYGGAGTVYLAERADNQFHAKVAIKVIDPTAAIDLGLRFRVERQILASLNHPNIARLLDAGEMENGQPYLIMEYVEGQTLEEYCDERRLDLRQRLTLFVNICAAVQYAHQNLIIHRDIKPANVLVTSAGVPKLLDFGIAKIMHARELGRTAELTRITGRVLTPEYASPEQVTGGAVTTASDIYSLGVVLYRLLSGLRPYELPDTASQLELERSICVVDAPRPSSAIQRAMQGAKALREPAIAQLAAMRSLTPERLRRELTGDLDAIVMRALRKEPEHRYSSVERLVADVQSYLVSEPVQARQGNWVYYSQRFVRRHTVAVVAAAGMILLLIGVAIVMSIQRQNIAAALARATLDRERAEDVSQFLLSVFSAADPYVHFGREPTARALLDQAARNIHNDLTQQPDVRARLLETIGRSYTNIGRPGPAATHLREALIIKQRLGAPPAEIGAVITDLAIALRQAGSVEESDRYLTEARLLLASSHLGEPTIHARLIMNMSRLESMRGDTAQALQYARHALELMRSVKGNNDIEVAAILADMSNVMVWADDLEGAEQAAREAVQIFEHAPDNHPDRLLADRYLADILMYRGRLEEAAGLFERVLAAQRRLYGTVNSTVADTLGSLAQVKAAQGKLAEASELISEALTAHRESDSIEYLRMGYLQTMLATFRLRQRAFGEAETLLRATLELFQQEVPADHQYVASAEHYLGETLLAQKKWSEAANVLTASMDRWTRSGAPAWRAARSANALGEALQGLGRADEAEQRLVESYRVLMAEPAADQEAKDLARDRLTRFYTSRGESAKLSAVLAESASPPAAAPAAKTASRQQER